MKQNKTVIVLIGLSLFITSTCLFATYSIYKHTPGIDYSNSLTTKEGLQLKDEMIKRLESKSLLSLNSQESLKKVAFNDFMSFPTREHFEGFEQELNKIFSQAKKDIYEMDSYSVQSSSFMINNTEKEFKVSAIFKNVTKDMLKITVENGFLTVFAESKVSKEESNDKKFSMVRPYKKVIKLPTNINLSKAEVSFVEDILIIKIPKTEIKKVEPVILKIK